MTKRVRISGRLVISLFSKSVCNYKVLYASLGTVTQLARHLEFFLASLANIVIAQVSDIAQQQQFG